MAASLEFVEVAVERQQIEQKDLHDFSSTSESTAAARRRRHGTKVNVRVRDLVAMLRLETLRPGLDMDLHRGAPDALDLGVDLQHVADTHRLDEGHPLDHDRHHAALRAFDARDAAGLVHVRHHPAAEDVAVCVGVGRHRDRAYRKGAARLGLFAPTGLARGFCHGALPAISDALRKTG